MARSIAAVVAGVLTVTCTESTAPPVDTRTVATIIVAPDSISMRVGFDLQMTAVLLDSTGDTLTDRPVQWTSSDTTLATVTVTGLVTAHQPGHVLIQARADTAVGHVLLTVLTPVSWVGPIPDTATLVPNGELALGVEVRGPGGVLSDRLVTWSSSDTSVVVVDSQGHLTARAAGVALVTPTSEGVASPSPARIVVALAQYVALGSGPEADHTCAIESLGGVRCWGNNFSGQLGNGTFKSDSGIPFMGAVPYPTGVIDQGGFIALSGGGWFTCGLVASFPGATTGAASCWGDGGDFRLGNGSIRNVPVPGYVRFNSLVASLTTGFEHGCLIAAADSLLYCWGETGIGAEPQLVSPTLKFAAVSGGYHATCGQLVDSAAYCWGMVGAGQHNGPFVAVTMGSEHACAIRTDSTAVCWGKNDLGQLGDSTTTARTAPVPVRGGYRFTALAGGNRSTCGITTTGAVVCWGGNDRGQLGGTAGDVCQGLPCRLVPGPVADPPGATLDAQHLVLGTAHACVLNADQRVYCWGWNVAGQLGDGTTVDRSTPVRVVGQN